MNYFKEKEKKYVESRGTLRVLRADTWLTVYRTIAIFMVKSNGVRGPKIKLQYDIFKVNRTKRVTIKCNFTRNENAAAKFTDVCECLVQPINRGSVFPEISFGEYGLCRAGGQPLTGSPPGTRRAETSIFHSF